MLNTILGKKIGMSQVFDKDGNMIPITLVEAGPCVVIRQKTEGADGYNAVCIGFDDKKEKHTNKPDLGIFKKANTAPKRIVREVKVDAKDLEALNQGAIVKIDSVFKEGDYIDVVGTTKGRGFTGVVKKWRFNGFPASRGTHEFFRHGGSIGQRAWPGKIFKNMKMPGHYGCDRVTIQNLKVVKVIPEDNLIMIMGAVPGHNNGYLIIKTAVKKGHKNKKTKD